MRFRQYNTVRTDALEYKIAFYASTGNPSAERALRDLARSISAPIREAEIEKHKTGYEAEIAKAEGGAQ